MAWTCVCTCGRQWPLNLSPRGAEVALSCPGCGGGATRLVPTTPVKDAVTVEPPADAEATLPPPADDTTLPPRARRDEVIDVEPMEEYPASPVSGRRYDILRELGRGGMGVVYQARQRGLNRVVALKVLLAGSHAGDAERDRFRVEAEAVARLRHPNVVQVFETGVQDGLPYLSLEYCDGGTLTRRLQGQPLPPRDAAVLVERLARGVQAAHDCDILHRDLKPENVLFGSNPPADEAWQPKITDFGLAKKLDDSGGKTRTGAVMGTPSYMAPEQAEGRKDVGRPADIYALGAILYECLTGRPPFRAATPLDTILQVVSEDPVLPRRLNSKVPRDLEVICMKCLQKTPPARYPRAGDLADDLQRFLAGDPIRARPPGLIGRAWKAARKRPVYALLTVLISVGVVVSMINLIRSSGLLRDANGDGLQMFGSLFTGSQPPTVTPATVSAPPTTPGTPTASGTPPSIPRLP